MSTISIVVPVYMVEPYLHRCINSILDQSYCDFELILVDDGSPDRCGIICEEYAEQDSRVRVLHQKNRGLSAARNTGIDWTFQNSDSQWITFVDSDDWLHPQMLEILLKNALQLRADVSVCGFAEVDGHTAAMEIQDPDCSDWCPEDFFLEHNTNAVVAWGKLYRRSCFAEIRYPEGKIHEDEFTTYQILFAQKKIAVTQQQLYCYFQNDTGITRSVWQPKHLVVLQALEEQIAYFAKHGFIRAHDRTAVCYAGKLCHQKRCVKNSALPEKEKKEYLTCLNEALGVALHRYWRIYCRRYNLDIFFEIFPAVGAVYRGVKKLSSLGKKGC